MKPDKNFKIVLFLLFLYSVYYWATSLVEPYYNGALDGFAALQKFPGQLLHLLLLIVTGVLSVYFFRKYFYILLIGISSVFIIAGIVGYRRYLNAIFSNEEVGEILINSSYYLPSSSSINRFFIMALLGFLVSIAIIFYYLSSNQLQIEKLVIKLKAFKRWYRIQINKNV